MAELVTHRCYHHPITHSTAVIRCGIAAVCSPFPDNTTNGNLRAAKKSPAASRASSKSNSPSDPTRIMSSTTTAARRQSLSHNLSGRSSSPAPNVPAMPTTPMSRRNTASGHRPSISLSGSPLSARSSVKTRPQTDNETELEAAAMLEDIRTRLAKSESAAEAAAQEYSLQIKALQLRLDEAQKDYAKVEEQMHSKEDAIENMQIQIKELTRSKRDQENIYEAERIAAQQDRQELLDRDEELNTIIQRLKDTLAQRQNSSEQDGTDNANADESVDFAPSGPAVPQTSLLLQKDKLIESLRMELAEAQIRLAEADHLEGSKVQKLEQQLLEARVTNARLVEDNDSFQLLLSTAALNGEFPRGDYLTNAFSDVDPGSAGGPLKSEGGSPRNSMGLNLADELNGVEEDDEDAQQIKKLEGELKTLREQNKAMSLYISGIIERILQHKDSEAILDKTAPVGGSKVTEKPLPPKPVEEKERAASIRSVATAPIESPKTTERPGLVIRTHSLNPQRKPAPGPFRPENMNAALGRSSSLRGPPGGHKRSKSDIGQSFSSAGVNNIYRGEGVITPRAGPFYATGDYVRPSRTRDSSSSLNSAMSDTDGSSVSSPPYPSTPIGPISGKTLRPLTLVQKNSGVMSPTTRKISGDYMDHFGDDGKTDSKRNSKRQSWMGWFNRNKDEPAATVSIAESVVFEGKDVE
ncbi:Similar to hypothetical protein [Tuber melanosporum Mel28]; acc. no. XP_002837700 [Pyronema omphalodes CBS 100304]|uniref:Uncharacterized protein n=1 Tax=Pyronema omphalodes (strain CBS 100304) TaxID=1076935 RepID=U4L2I2_PYROM|nr:Similar to hypothetical protein [Tuber melanosporum Mel28]; acc. no. XP_002837700 [Pyronema omphalodes CBS 100304]